jgi:hypothetical protein
VRAAHCRSARADHRRVSKRRRVVCVVRRAVGSGSVALERELPEHRCRCDRSGCEQEVATRYFSHL